MAIQDVLRFIFVLLIGFICGLIYNKYNKIKLKNNYWWWVTILFGFVGAVMGQYFFEIIRLNDLIDLLQDIPNLNVNVILSVLGAGIVLWILGKIAPGAGSDIR